MHPTAVIATDDGASIRIEGRGYARRESQDDRHWQVVAALRFDAPDQRYTWLDDTLGFWKGEFDAVAHRARYRAYASGESTASGTEQRVPTAASFTRADGGRERRDCLEPQQRALYREILLAFARGEPPTRNTLAALACDLDLAAALARFEELDLVRADPETGHIVVAYPFSGRPTAHRLALPGGRQAYAMCAVDALGVAAMLGSRVRVRSRDPISSEEIVVDVSPDGEAQWSPRQAVVFVGGSNGDQWISDLCCSVVNFFASRETAGR
jgi:hypothetical protein